jgi:hypothetical protein
VNGPAAPGAGTDASRRQDETVGYRVVTQIRNDVVQAKLIFPYVVDDLRALEVFARSRFVSRPAAETNLERSVRTSLFGAWPGRAGHTLGLKP